MMLNRKWIENIFNKRFEVNNLFIFEYICYMIFGERIIVDNFDDAYDKYTNSDNKYFTLTDFNYNIYFNKSYTKKIWIKMNTCFMKLI